MIIGVVGKPNVGKSTFFKALTLMNVEIAPHPFTTIKPNRGIAYVRLPCPERDFNAKCNPNNSPCIRRNRFVPVEILDVAGLVPGAHEGKGLGNQFLDDLRQADVLIHIVDSSGETDSEGNPSKGHKPKDDIAFLEKEIDLWFFGIISRNWDPVIRRARISGKDIVDEITEMLSGLGIKRSHVVEVMLSMKIGKEELIDLGRGRMESFASELRKVSKPILVVGNKIDRPDSRENMSGIESVCCSAEIELALREADSKGIIEYVPGDAEFYAKDMSPLNEQQRKALEFMGSFLKRNNGTGVQQAINHVVFDMLKAIVVFPVENENRLTNNKGKVLPDALLLPGGSSALDLAYKVHSDIGDGFIKAIDCRTKRPVGKEHILKTGDVVKIFSRK